MKIQSKTPDLVPVIVGTAGHVDHGKTSLVLMLTGCDTDRLPEEKARGMSIDLGFAPCKLHGERLAGVVDVPGHRDFIRSMVAGAFGIDILLLVVAADDGIMPQTLEHTAIAHLLGVQKCLVALTKIDLASAQRTEEVRQQLRELCEANAWPDAPIHPVSNVTGEGIGELRESLEALIAGISKAPTQKAFRMPVERAFHLEGHGTVVAGIPLSGHLTPDMRVELLPGGSVHRVRQVQSYRFKVGTAQAGICCAINLADLSHDQVHRGQMLCAPGIYTSSDRIVIHLEHIHSRPLKRHQDVFVHAGTASTHARLYLYYESECGQGQSDFAILALDQALCLAAGDRILLRSPELLATVAGGRIVSTQAPRTRRELPKKEHLESALLHLKQGNLLLGALLAGPHAITGKEQVLALTQCPESDAKNLVQAAIDRHEIVALGQHLFLINARRQELQDRVERLITLHHRRKAATWGLSPSELTTALKLDSSAALPLAALVTSTGNIVQRHGRLGLAAHLPKLTQAQAAMYDKLIAAIHQAKAAGLAPGNALKDLGIDDRNWKQLSRLAIDEGHASALGSHLIDRQTLEGIKTVTKALLSAQGSFDLATFRSATGLSRNLAVTVLEMFDASGITRRDGDRRIPG